VKEFLNINLGAVSIKFSPPFLVDLDFDYNPGRFFKSVKIDNLKPLLGKKR